MFGCITASLPLVGYMLSNQQTNHITSRFWTSIVLYIKKLVCLVPSKIDGMLEN